MEQRLQCPYQAKDTVFMRIVQETHQTSKQQPTPRSIRIGKSWLLASPYKAENVHFSTKKIQGMEINNKVLLNHRKKINIISASVPNAGVSALALVIFGAESLLVDGGRGGWHRHFMMLSSIPGFCLLNASSTSPSSCDNQECLLTLPTASWKSKLPPLENYWHTV